MVDQVWREEHGEGPLLAAAVHAGHAVRDEVGRLLGLDEQQRLREEDPYTDEWTLVVPTRIVGLRSRFEVDLNRPRDKAVYRGPDDAWGLAVWRQSPSDGLLRRSLEEYDAFYGAMRELLEDRRRRFGRFVMYDLHSYNHRRGGAEGPVADAMENPQVNIGTGTMDRQRWAPIVDRFISELRAYDFPGGRLDVRENVRFRGGNFPRWVHETFPESGVAIAIEFKKFFMNEWTGAPDRMLVDAIGAALASTVPGVLDALEAG